MMDTLKFKNNSYVVVFQVVTLRLILVLFIFFQNTTSSICSIIGYCKYDISSNFMLLDLQ